MILLHGLSQQDSTLCVLPKGPHHPSLWGVMGQKHPVDIGQHFPSVFLESHLSQGIHEDYEEGKKILKPNNCGKQDQKPPGRFLSGRTFQSIEQDCAL